MNLSERRYSKLHVPLNSNFTSHFKENRVDSMQIKVVDTGTFIRLFRTKVFFFYEQLFHVLKGHVPLRQACSAF